MEYPVRSSVITGFLSQTTDRFHVYNPKRTFEERLALAASIEGMTGVEIVHPYEVPEPAALKALLAKHRLSVSAINCNIKAEPEFRNGGPTSPDPAVRAKAARFVREAKDYAAAVGADKVTCCPLADGYEFSFGCDYRSAWKRLVETFGEAAAHRPEIPLFIEYKPSETRGRCFVDNAAKTLCLLNDIGSARMGVTLDFGHSMYGRENPAEALSLLAASRYPCYIHINDNDARWDWDYMVGTKHMLDYVEFLYYLQEYGYRDFITSDTSPTRWDIAGTFAQNVRLTNKLWTLVAGLDRKAFGRLIDGGDYIATWKFIEKEIFRL